MCSYPSNSKKLKSLVSAIYERYSEISECANSDNYLSSSPLDISSSSTSSSSSSSSPCSSSSSPTSVQDTSAVNSPSSSCISFFMPTACSPRKTQTGLVMTSISLVMSDQEIDYVGDAEELEFSCKNVQELDLSKNELTSWIEIKKILDSLKNLRLLNLSQNQLGMPDLINNETIYDEQSNYVRSTIEFFKTEWNLLNSNSISGYKLNILILNSCFVDLKIIQCLIEKMNYLTELHLCSNNYSHVNFDTDFHKPSLKVLYFNNNNLSSWKEVCKLGRSFPNLENLVISHNNIEKFTSTDDELNTSRCFKNLQILIINKLNIDEWHVIDQLRDFPHLRHVRIQNIPLLHKLNDEEKYYMLVAHLDESIDSLNGSKITNDDKENCERKYIRYFMDLANKPKRYYELESKHGKLNKLADVNLEINKRVQVKIKYGDKHIFDKIDVRQTVGDFKKHLEKFVGHSSNRFKVFYIDIEACSMSIYGPEELKHINRCLYSFNIRDGDEFEIDLKPPPQQGLHTSSSDYQFQHHHLHHLHYHHFNSHLNTNSHHQIPLFNNSSMNGTSTSRPFSMRNRKVSDSIKDGGGSLSSESCCQNRVCKKTKPGMLSPTLNSSRLINNNQKNNSKSKNESQIHDYCSLPSNLNKQTKENKLNAGLRKLQDRNNNNILGDEDSLNEDNKMDSGLNGNLVVFTTGDNQAEK